MLRIHENYKLQTDSEAIEESSYKFQKLDISNKLALIEKINPKKFSFVKIDEPRLEILSLYKFKDDGSLQIIINNLSDRPIAFRILLQEDIVDNYIARPNAGLIPVFDIITITLIERFYEIPRKSFLLDLQVMSCPCNIISSFTELINYDNSCSYKQQKNIVKALKFTHSYKIKCTYF